MAHNALWHDLRAVRVLEERVAASPSDTVTHDRVSSDAHVQHVVSDIIEPYVPMTAEGRHEALLCEMSRTDAARPDVDVTLAGIEDSMSAEVADLFASIELLKGAQTFEPESYDEYDEPFAQPCTRCGASDHDNPFLCDDEDVVAFAGKTPDPAWADLGTCDGCGAEGKRGAWHRLDLDRPFWTYCGEYR